MDIFYNDMFSPKAALCVGKEGVRLGKAGVLYNMQYGFPRLWKCAEHPGEEIEEMMRLKTAFVSGRGRVL